MLDREVHRKRRNPLYAGAAVRFVDTDAQTERVVRAIVHLFSTPNGIRLLSELLGEDMETDRLAEAFDLERRHADEIADMLEIDVQLYRVRNARSDSESCASLS